MKTKPTSRRQIGEIGVDAGLCWIGDPCDILHDDDQYPTCKQLNYDLGHPGLGVVVSTGYGDGVYPVFAEFNDEGRVARICVEFIADDETKAA